MIRIFLKMKEQYIKTEMEYPFNFWMMLLAGVVTRFVGMAVPFVICQNIPVIAGWKEEEVYLILAFLFIAEGTCSIVFEGSWKIPEMVFTGQLDNILSRPISPLYQVLSYGIGLQGIGVLAVGIVSLCYFLRKLGKWNAGTIILSLFLIVCGVLICMSIQLISNSLVFWYDSGGRTSVPYAIQNIGQYARYPLSIYPSVVQGMLLFLLPYGCIGVVPAMIMKGEHVVEYCIFMAVVSIVFLLLGRGVFYRGIRRYESVGM